MSGGRTALVVNALARTGEEQFDRARAALERSGVALSAAHRVRDPAELRRRIRAELRRGADRVLVGGGDGTLAAAAAVLAGSGAALGILPLGTANDFARALGIPSDLGRACRVVAGGRRRAVDVGLAGTHAFLNAASVGASSEVARRVKPSLKRHLGPFAYALAGAAAAATPPFRARLVADGVVRHDGWALQVLVGNGRFHGGGRLIAPGARPDDGALDVYVLAAPAGAEEGGGIGRARGALTLARYAALLLRGRHVEHPGLLHVRARRVALTTDPPLDIDADGEVTGRTPAVFRVAAGVLEVIAPRRDRRRRLRGSER